MAPTAQKLDPVTRALMNAPVSKEPLTGDEKTAFAETREHLLGGGALVSQEDVERLAAARLVGGT